MSSFNRSQFLKDRWGLARQKQQTYNSLTDGQDKKFGVKEFFKRDNVLDRGIHIYFVSTQANYRSSEGGIYTEPKTFKVIGYTSPETENKIISSTNSAVASMIVAGNSFNPQFQSAIESHTKTSIDKVRGLEEVAGTSLSQAEYMALTQGTLLIRDLDKNIVFSKNHKGKSESKLYKGTMDLSGFL